VFYFNNNFITLGDERMKDWLDKAKIHLEKTRYYIDEGCSECKDCIENECRGYKIKNLLNKAYKLFPKKVTIENAISNLKEKGLIKGEGDEN
jgi:hypothetical protein